MYVKEQKSDFDCKWDISWHSIKLPIEGRSQWDAAAVLHSRTTVSAAEKPKRMSVTALLLVA